MTETVSVELTIEEIKQIVACLGEGYADGDYRDWLDAVEDDPAAAENALKSGWNKLGEAWRRS